MVIPNITIPKKSVDQYQGELLVTFVGLTDDAIIAAPQVVDLAGEVIEGGDFKAKGGDQLLLYPPYSQKSKVSGAKRLLLLGLGNIEKIENDTELKEQLRIAGGRIAAAVGKAKAKNIGILLPDLGRVSAALMCEHIIEGVLLGSYRFDKYRTKVADDDEKEPASLKKINVYLSTQQATTRKGINRAIFSSTATWDARDMANEPGNGWTPSQFGSYAKSLAKRYGLKCTILEKNQMKKLGMGGILAVNQGSDEPPKCVILDHNPPKAKDTILIVGKGLTFDSGGISLKPAAGMMDMKYDMCGGAAAISAMKVVAEEKPKVRVVCIVPSTDNMSGGSALKPGDIITHYSGITSEIENTDAEGRLILADAIAYGVEKYNPTCVVDLATLTGAVVIALGHHTSGLMSNNNTLAKKLLEAGQSCGEPLWRLPLGKEYAKQIKSKVADIKNTGGRPGGSITAAEYLHKFVGKTPWAHLDIAGTAWDFTKKTYIPAGPSGIGVRTLTEFIRNWNSKDLLV